MYAMMGALDLTRQACECVKRLIQNESVNEIIEAEAYKRHAQDGNQPSSSSPAPPRVPWSESAWPRTLPALL